MLLTFYSILFSSHIHLENYLLEVTRLSFIYLVVSFFYIYALNLMSLWWHFISILLLDFLIICLIFKLFFFFFWVIQNYFFVFVIWFFIIWLFIFQIINFIIIFILYYFRFYFPFLTELKLFYLLSWFKNYFLKILLLLITTIRW